ncbi:uncharacterized protein MONOS_3342 [Monocercomonoides exilis]|uniref:uncharacterized protein n=1 Tax=Monocercomonoides exilis TaxID=2049356 RepID=UPI003559A131|nr:hypothetical protein MONOS_3342 [Monocercomonoides exilis]|eukprot:MONOS_3342.1-p1 / transcript=MONOS_3342.1 / gene=MONOS_3342 / organism=Monocercomonoides_exilis_PA203 / gene_product=unspecified product / transcript_product=unspecified product / location=Mono_scaffold00078:12696-16733(-) / protein_length=1346 / sequence_SO=supercontig / SO=protein_coding / is_pseudo=false
MIAVLVALACEVTCFYSKRQSLSERNSITEGGSARETPITIIYISERGNDSNPDCGIEAEPCKSVAKGIERLGDNRGDKTLKIKNFAKIDYDFLFNKDFCLTMASVSNGNTRGTLIFDLKDLTENGHFHMINEKILKLERLAFNLIPFKSERPIDSEDEAQAVILSKSVHGDLSIRDCNIKIDKWNDNFVRFSILNVLEGKVSIDGFDMELFSNSYYSNGPILHISEDVTLQKLRGFEFGKVTLSKECALELPSSFTLEGSHTSSVERITAGPALLEAKSEANKRVDITISKCSISSQSLLSEKGGCFYFEMMHSDSELNILDTTFTSGKAAKGGGMMIGAMKGTVKLESVMFFDCEAAADGGGLLINDLTQMTGFECVNVSFERCKAQSGGGVYFSLDEEDFKGDGIFFRDCFFATNEVTILANDVMFSCKGDFEMNKSPFDAACMSSTKKERVVVKKQNNISTIHDDWLKYNSFEVDVDSVNGSDNVECGKEGNKPCKTIKKAIENCLPGRLFHIYSTKNCNDHDTEPITVENLQIKISSRGNREISIMTNLDETKVLPGEGLFNVKHKGKLQLSGANVKIDSTQTSGRDCGLVIGDGENVIIDFNRVNITPTDTKQALNCVLLKIRFGELKLIDVSIRSFISSFALILTDDSKNLLLMYLSVMSTVTTSKTQSIFTVLKGCQSITCECLEFDDCHSTKHGLGGVLYMEIGTSEHDILFDDLSFNNCSCQGEYLNSFRNEESKGGAMYIQVADEMTGLLKLQLNDVIFTECNADKGKLIYISLPAGIKQLDEDMFVFEMEDMFGKGNLMLLEERKGGEVSIIDLMVDEAYRLPYHSSRIFIGGESANSKKSCGRKDEPCDLIRTGKQHRIMNDELKMLIIGRVTVDEPFLCKFSVSLTSASDIFSFSSSLKEPNRGILQIGAQIGSLGEIAVFDMTNNEISLKHVDIEYPDAVEGDAIDLFYGRDYLQIIDVVFRPWYTGLKGENVQGGEGKQLPYKLIVHERYRCEINQLVVYGRNGNLTEEKHLGEGKMSGKNFRNYDDFSDDQQENEQNEDYKPLCMWDSGLISLNGMYEVMIEDSSFVNISEGVIVSISSGLIFNNCSFTDNHPVGENWEKFPSLRHNIHFFGKTDNRNAYIYSLAEGSDGLNGKPFGMLSDTIVKGDAAADMDSSFFIPFIKNTSLIKEENRASKEKQGGEMMEEDDGTFTVVVRGSYLFPCGIAFEAMKESKGQDSNWIECPIFEYVNETEMKVKVPRSLFDEDESSSVICRLSFPAGIDDAEKRYSENKILKPKKNNSKLTSTQLTIIIVSVSTFAITVLITVMAVVYVVRNKKRRHYNTITDLEK